MADLFCTCGGEASKRWPGQHAVTCPQRDPEHDERLRADLAAIRAAEQRALNPGEAGVWTVGPEGRANTSLAFQHVARDVERIIRGDAHKLISGHADQTARLIVAHLAHKHGMTVEVAHRDDC